VVGCWVDGGVRKSKGRKRAAGGWRGSMVESCGVRGKDGLRKEREKRAGWCSREIVKCGEGRVLTIFAMEVLLWGYRKRIRVGS
jgi:hypothetical protein